MADKETKRIGHGLAGPGRKRGVPNKTTALIREAVTEAFELNGGVDSLVTWAKENPTEFFKLWGRMAPVQAELSGKDGGVLVIRVVKE